MRAVGTSMMFSRYSDGARPVLVLEDGWRVASLKGGEPLTFTTAGALLAELTGHPTGRHWSIDRYFGLGRYTPRQDNLIGQANILELFSTASSRIVLLEPLAPDLLAFPSNIPDTAISIPQDTRQSVERCNRPSQSGSGLGIDLAGRGHEVRKLLFACFGRRIWAAGYEIEDVLQDVYKGLLTRNQGKCPWDPSKSSFGHYVYMVISCVLSNYHRKQVRRRQFEQIGLTSYQDGEYRSSDVAANTNRPAPPTLFHEQSQYGEVMDDLVDYLLTLPRRQSIEAQHAIDVLPYVTNSTPRARIAEILGVSMAAISRAISFLRKAARAWKQTTCY